ncbi:hypothetical protein V5799_003740 [Amblyomma americanum]|uniref:Peptidase M13 N-terminal domain-containing protein n=1 Tax=Amblyomma americanum TaxID=6943 RepID=A0AAQ4D834_AMBAM
MSAIDNRTIGKPFSYLRPNIPMPRRYVEQAAFPEPEAADSSSDEDTSTASSGQSVASHEDASVRIVPSAGTAQSAKNSAAKIPSTKTSTVKTKPSKVVRSLSDSTVSRAGFSADRVNTTALSPVGSASSLTSGSGAASPTSEGDWDDEDDDAETDKTTAATSEDALKSSGRDDTLRGITLKHIKKHAVVVAIVSLIVSLALIVVIQVMPETGDHHHGTGDTEGQRPSEDEGESVSYGGSSGQRRVATSFVTLPPELQATPARRFTLADYEDTRTGGDRTTPSGALECNTDACSWQRRLVEEKLNVNVDPCVDFYSYVCSPAWEVNGSLPYKSAGRAFLIKETIR